MYLFIYFCYLFLLDNMVQDNKVHRRHFSSVMTTRVQKMTHVLMYVYFNPSCVKAVGGGLQGLMYKLIILIITRTTAM